MGLHVLTAGSIHVNVLSLTFKSQSMCATRTVSEATPFIPAAILAPQQLAQQP